MSGVVSEAFCIEIQGKLHDLRVGKLDELVFPNDLDNTQRRYIHTIAKKLGFHSKSKGKGETRCITVSLEKKVSGQVRSNVVQRPGVFHLPNTMTSNWTSYFNQFPITEKEHEGVKQHHRVTCPPAVQKKVKGGSRQFSALTDAPSTVPPPKQNDKLLRRQNLPAWNAQEQICTLVRDNPVVIISGETGCGKSTQIPQFLLDAPGNDRRRIVVTQPRRLSATALAERIADERGEKIGQTVGYSIRMETKMCENTQLIFVTTGTLLRWMASDPKALSFSHVILDEVHERDRYSDFLLIRLRDLLRTRKDLRLILMSATIQTETFVNYFENCPLLEIPGRVFPVKDIFLEETLLMTQMAVPQEGQVALQMKATSSSDWTCPLCGTTAFPSAAAFGIHAATCFGPTEDDTTSDSVDVHRQQTTSSDISTSLYPGSVCDRVCTRLGLYDGMEKSVVKALVQEYDAVATTRHMELSCDLDLILQVLIHIEEADYGPGAILVFLPGWDDISQLHERLMDHRRFSSISEFTILQLHSSLPSHEQRLVFKPVPAGVRKIILSTNIAETSLTIDDVVYVIDTGLAKLKSYDIHMKMSTLQTSWIAQSSVWQRRGRAGRVSSGVCFHLFSQSRLEAMLPFYPPELLRTPLVELALQVKLIDSKVDIASFLRSAPDPPQELAITLALDHLVDIAALTPTSFELTNLGTQLAQLPLDPTQGKSMLVGHFLGCFSPLVRVRSMLSYRDPFLMLAARRQESTRAKLKFCPQPIKSDAVMYYNVMHAFKACRSGQEERNFCSRNSLSQPILSTMARMERQLLGEFRRLGYSPCPKEDLEGSSLFVFLAAVAQGNYPDLVYRYGGSRNYTTRDHHKVKLRASSVLPSMDSIKALKNSSKNIEWLSFDEMVMTDKSRVLQQGSTVSDICLLLIWGEMECLLVSDVVPDNDDNDNDNDDTFLLEEETTMNAIVQIENWIQFSMPEALANEIIVIRRRFRLAFHDHIAGHAPSANTILMLELLQTTLTESLPTSNNNHNNNPSSYRGRNTGYQGRGNTGYQGRSPFQGGFRGNARGGRRGGGGFRGRGRGPVRGRPDRRGAAGRGRGGNRSNE